MRTFWKKSAAGALIAAFLASASAAGPSIVVDVATGAVLSAEEPHRRWYPASLTKLMTTYLALEAVSDGRKTLKSPVVISKNALSEPPSKMGYPVGSVLTLENAIRIMMVKSANDVSVAVGEAISGSELEFVEAMNATAARLGMTGTRFANPNGLHSPDQYTTARDMAVMVTALRREFPQHAGFFALEAIKAGKKTLTNYNILLGRYAGADGMKTGFVCASGFNLAASASRGGRTVTAIVLGATSPVERAESAAELLAAGFSANPASAPRIESFVPDVQPQTTTDFRPQVCSKKARAGRSDERDENGKMIFRTPHLLPMDREPATVRVALGGATGLAGPSVDIAAVPVPTPRPDHKPAALEKIAMEEAGIGPIEVGDGSDPVVPVPTPRPSATK